MSGHTSRCCSPWPRGRTRRAVVWRVLPGVDLAAVPLEPAPPRARWRSPVQWRRLAVGHDDRVAMVRRGMVVRHHAVVPHARTQSVRVTQGPWERALDLASVHVDSTPGPVAVPGLHLDAGLARAFAEGQADRARLARARAERSCRPPELTRRDSSALLESPSDDVVLTDSGVPVESPSTLGSGLSAAGTRPSPPSGGVPCRRPAPRCPSSR